MQQHVQQALTLAAGDDSFKLDLEFAGKVAKRAQTMKKDEMPSPPSLKLTSEATTPYIAIAVDLDAPYTSVPLLSPLLHWIQPGLKPDKIGTLEHEIPCVVDWLPPSPPPFHEPHRYLIILYQQPPDVDFSKWNSRFVKPVGLSNRIRWDLDDFAQQAGLHKMIAANYVCY